MLYCLATDQLYCPLAPAPQLASPPGTGTRLNSDTGRTLLTRTEVRGDMHIAQLRGIMMRCEKLLLERRGIGEANIGGR